MARRKKKGGGGGGGQGWLVTFSDLMTLLLTFFVLLLSMSSMDRTLLTRISAMKSDLAVIAHSGSGRIPDNIKLLLEIVNDPRSILEKRDRIKDLLFPNDILPPELPAGTLDENLLILAHPEGVVIVLTEGLLFGQGEYSLNPTGKRMLEALLPFLHYTTADVNISGHTDNTPMQNPDNYTLSTLRAMAALEYFLQQQLPPVRFSISGYGADKPLFPNDSPKHQGQNRRVELLVKTTQWLGRYL